MTHQTCVLETKVQHGSEGTRKQGRESSCETIEVIMERDDDTCVPIPSL